MNRAGKSVLACLTRQSQEAGTSLSLCAVFHSQHDTFGSPLGDQVGFDAKEGIWNGIVTRSDLAWQAMVAGHLTGGGYAWNDKVPMQRPGENDVGIWWNYPVRIGTVHVET